MVDSDRHARRTFLKTATTASLVGLAGCSGGNADGGDGSDGGTGGSDGGGGDGGGGEQSPGTEEPVVKDEREEIEFAFMEGASAGIVTQIMLNEGVDSKHNLHVNFKKMGLNEAQNAFFRGQVEASAVGPIPLARANAKSGVDVKIAAPVIRNHHALLVKPDSSYEKVEDLVGKRIASFPRQSSSFNSYALLMNEMGYDWENDFNLTLTSTINILNLFDRGDVEAATHFEPFVTRWVAPNKARPMVEVRDLYEEAFGRPQQFASIGVQSEIIENEPSRVIKLHRAYMDTLKLIQEDTDRIIDRFSDAYGLKSDKQIKLAKERIPKIYLPQWDDKVINSGKADIEASMKNGLLTKDASADVFWRPPEQ